jgi:tight adherence protein C
MTPYAAGAAAGAMVGGGLWLLARELWPAGPDLRALVHPPRAPLPAQSTAAHTAQARLGRWAARVTGGALRIPHRDLAVLRQSPDVYLAQVVLCALYGLLLPLVLGMLAGFAGLLGGWRSTLGIPAALGVLSAIVLATTPASTVKTRATRARREFRVALAGYLELIALERAADADPGEAVVRAATVAHGWAFQRIRDAIDASRLTGAPPWRVLGQLGDELGVAELSDLASTVEVAGGGGRIYDTLVAKAASMRSAAQADARTHGNAVSTRMQIPATLIFYALLVLILFPLLTGLR